MTKIDKDGFIDALDAKKLDYDVVDENGKTVKSTKGNVGIYDPFGQCMPIAAADDFVGAKADFIKNQKSWSA